MEKTELIQTRVTKPEKEIVKFNAKDNGLTISEYIRSLLFLDKYK